MNERANRYVQTYGPTLIIEKLRFEKEIIMFCNVELYNMERDLNGI